MPNSGAGGFLGEGGALVASQLMADETERSSSLSSSEPRLPLMKRPRGDWRLRPLLRERWRRLPRLLLGEVLGTHAVACPGAVDMVEPMVGFGFFERLFERLFGAQETSPAVVFLRRAERFRGRFLASERLNVRGGSTGRAVLQLCALYSRATAVSKRQLLGHQIFTAPNVFLCSAKFAAVCHGPREALPQVSQ